MSSITTHALDTARGVPASKLPLVLEAYDEGTELWSELVRTKTNDDGRVPGFTDGADIVAGLYKIRFDTTTYWREHGIPQGFYPFVEVFFTVAEAQHYHVPLLISPFGYSTYRGS